MSRTYHPHSQVHRRGSRMERLHAVLESALPPTGLYRRCAGCRCSFMAAGSHALYCSHCAPVVKRAGIAAAHTAHKETAA